MYRALLKQGYSKFTLEIFEYCDKSYRIVSETTLNKMKVRKQSEKAKICLFPSIPVQVFNVEIKQVLVYNSKLIDARAIGVSNSTIRHYIIKKGNFHYW